MPEAVVVTSPAPDPVVFPAPSAGAGVAGVVPPMADTLSKLRGTIVGIFMVVGPAREALAPV